MRGGGLEPIEHVLDVQLQVLGEFGHRRRAPRLGRHLLVRLLHGRGLPPQLDLGRLPGAADAVDELVGGLGAVDVLVNGAGTGTSAPFLDLGYDTVRQVISTGDVVVVDCGAQVLVAGETLPDATPGDEIGFVIAEEGKAYLIPTR